MYIVIFILCEALCSGVTSQQFIGPQTSRDIYGSVQIQRKFISWPRPTNTRIPLFTSTSSPTPTPTSSPTPTPTSTATQETPPYGSILIIDGYGEEYYWNGLLHYFTSYTSEDVWCGIENFCGQRFIIDGDLYSQMEIGTPMFYPHDSLVQNDVTHEVFWIEQAWLGMDSWCLKHYLQNPNVQLQSLNKTPDDIIIIDDGELQQIPVGEPLPFP